MNTNMKRVISGLAALGIALSGMALGTSSAWASDPNDGSEISAGSTTINESDKGTITISGSAVEHKFNGYKLGYLTSISYNQIESANFDSASMTGYTLATNPTYKNAIETALGNITDTNATGDDSGKTLKARYLADKNYCGKDCGATGEPNDPNPLGWFFANYGGGYENKANWGGSKTGAASDATDASILRQFATRVSAAIAAASTHEDITLTSNAGDKSPEVPQGYYLLRDVTSHDNNNVETQSAPILVSTTYKVTIGTTPVTFTKDASNPAHDLGTVSLKNSTPTITKEVVTDKTGATPQTQPDYAVGDTVYYKLTATLPHYTGYAVGNRVYQITDTASKGLTVGTDPVVSVKVTPKSGDSSASAAQTLAKETDYTVASEETTDTGGNYVGGHTTTIDFAKYVNLAEGTQSKQSGILEDGTITVIFKATLNTKALISDAGANNIKGNPNKDSLTYSNQPENVQETNTTPGDEVNVYTYRFRLHKTDKGGNNLSGAKFKVKAPEGGDNDWLQWNTTASAWKHGSEENATEFVSNSNGEVVATVADGITVNLDRLDSGTYTVKETAAPEGYTQAFLPTFTFTITPTVGNEDAGHKTITNIAFSDKTAVTNDYVTDASAITATGTDNGAWQYTIYNAKNLTELPMTGGAGLVAIIAVGVLLAGAGTAAAVRSRKFTSRAVRV